MQIEIVQKKCFFLQHSSKKGTKKPEKQISDI